MRRIISYILDIGSISAIVLGAIGGAIGLNKLSNIPRHTYTSQIDGFTVIYEATGFGYDQGCKLIVKSNEKEFEFYDRNEFCGKRTLSNVEFDRNAEFDV